MAKLHLPPTLTSLFPDLPRRVEVDATTVSNAIAELDERWPGLYDRLLESGPSLLPHIHVYVDGERATLDSKLGDRSRLDVVAAISGG
jgi:molybdopterin synthase sulfur carrier subunit